MNNEIFQERTIIFFSLFTVLALLEIFNPFRRQLFTRIKRWPGNLLMGLINILILKIVMPSGLVGVSQFVERENIGIIHFFHLNNHFTSVFLFLFLDLSIYLQHRYFHYSKFFWKFHQAHHSDPDLDLTTSFRFHSVEILFSFVFKVILVLVLGINSSVVFLFEVVLSSMAMFNHSNVLIPYFFEKILRVFVVTPQMHIIHHSIEKKESDKNFGFNLSLWDFMFKTYQEKFQSNGTVGQKNIYGVGFLAIFFLPFKKKLETK